jgi:hypothetical protein
MTIWIEVDGRRHGFRDHTSDAQIEAWLGDHYGPGAPLPVQPDDGPETRSDLFDKERVLVARIWSGGCYRTIILKKGV